MLKYYYRNSSVRFARSAYNRDTALSPVYFQDSEEISVKTDTQAPHTTPITLTATIIDNEFDPTNLDRHVMVRFGLDEDLAVMVTAYFEHIEDVPGGVWYVMKAALNRPNTSGKAKVEVKEHQVGVTQNYPWLVLVPIYLCNIDGSYVLRPGDPD
jgi:hypothetical protein